MKKSADNKRHPGGMGEVAIRLDALAKETGHCYTYFFAARDDQRVHGVLVCALSGIETGASVEIFATEKGVAKLALRLGGYLEGLRSARIAAEQAVKEGPA